MASTSIKLAGGVSARDAPAISREIGCEPEFLQGMRKRPGHTEFACYIRNVTAQPVRMSIPFGQMEGRLHLSEAELERLLAINRSRFCAGDTNFASSAILPQPRTTLEPSGF